MLCLILRQDKFKSCSFAHSAFTCAGEGTRRTDRLRRPDTSLPATFADIQRRPLGYGGKCEFRRARSTHRRCRVAFAFLYRPGYATTYREYSHIGIVRDKGNGRVVARRTRHVVGVYRCARRRTRLDNIWFGVAIVKYAARHRWVGVAWNCSVRPYG